MSGIVNRKNGKKSGNNENKEPNIWNNECEELLAEWSEKASCYRWLHGRCEKSYRTWYYCFSIPVIILSTLTGAANVGMDSFVPQENKSMASAIVGGVNIFAGIVSTLQNFLKVAELMEGHRIAGVSWGKLQRNIAIELALDPERRVIQSDFLKLARAEYDRLIEAGPIIDDGVINQFNKKFKNYQVSIPSICNGLDKCNIYKVDKSLLGDKTFKDDLLEGIEDVMTLEEKEYNDKKYKIQNLKKMGTDKEIGIEVEIDEFNTENIEDTEFKTKTTDVPVTNMNKENNEDLELLIPTKKETKKETNDKHVQTDTIEEEEDDIEEDDLTKGF